MFKKPSDAKATEFDTRQLLAETNRKLLMASIVSGVTALAAVMAVVGLTPLKQSVPYIVTAAPTGEVKVVATETGRFEPQWIHKEYFLRQWISDLFTINRTLTVQITDPRAQAFLRGNTAIAQFDAFRKADQTYERLAKNPGLVRDVEIESLAPVAGSNNGAVATVKLTTRNGEMVQVEKRLVTVFWVEIPPKNRDEALVNPIGLYITDFKISSN